MPRSRTISTRLRLLVTLAVAAVAALAISGSASAKDRNHDRIPDKWEKKHKLSLKANQARRDQDHDKLKNLAEFKAGDNPRKADSDGDGTPDGEENAGTIASFDAATGKLTITLFGGDSISGFVTEETEIECGCGGKAGEEEVVTASASSEGSDQSGDDSEDGESSSGDESSPGDDDGPNHDLGDDHGGQGEGEHHGSCSTEDLVAGAAVQEAEIHLENGKAVFEKVELGRES